MVKYNFVFCHEKLSATYRLDKIKRRIKIRLVGWLVGFYGIQTFLGHLTPDSVYMYIH